ncbi:MAG: chemotaxis response regulator protein-glutamate methylesterase [Thermodesulfobacteriota bacterium]
MRVAIVNSHPEAISAISASLALSPEHEITWTTGSGEEALIRCRTDRPDLIFMGMVLTGMDGARTTERIMAECPCAILVVTRSVAERAAMVFEAMGHGALDAVSTPVMTPEGRLSGAEELLTKISVVGRLLGKASKSSNTHKPWEKPDKGKVPPMLAIGASTGGPKALALLLSGLPRNFPAAVVVIQHVDANFADGLARWLDGQTNLPVRLARENEAPVPGQVVVAESNRHLIVNESGRLSYTDEPTDTVYRPSVDVFFMSAARNWWPRKAVAVLLTGMGRDGALGLSRLRRAGWYTIAQDEKTSVVYGMPKAAAELSAACEILPIEKIAGAIMRALAGGKR